MATYQLALYHCETSFRTYLRLLYALIRLRTSIAVSSNAHERSVVPGYTTGSSGLHGLEGIGIDILCKAVRANVGSCGGCSPLRRTGRTRCARLVDRRRRAMQLIVEYITLWVGETGRSDCAWSLAMIDHPECGQSRLKGLTRCRIGIVLEVTRVTYTFKHRAGLANGL